MPEIGERRVRTATFVVAASDSMVQDKAMADYICDGTNDHVEIQAALDALPATGGEVKLLDGTYYIESSLVLDSYQTLRGCGRNTILTTTTINLDIVTATGGAGTEKIGILLADLCVDGNAGGVANNNGILFTYVDYSIIRGVWAQDNTGHGICLTNCDFNEVINNFSLDNAGLGIFLNTSNNNTILDNFCQGNADGIYLGNSAAHNTITGNVCQGNPVGIYINSSTHNIISSNICQGNTDRGIYLYNSADYNAVSSNVCQGNSGPGIDVTSSNHNEISDNSCLENSQVSTNTHDDIFLATSDYNNIQGNTCRAGGLAAVPRYGINVSNAACDGNLVINNDLYNDGFGTAPFNDAGTGTRLNVFVATFVTGSDPQNWGFLIDAATENAYAWLRLPDKVVQVVRMKVYGSAGIAEADRMRLELAIDGGADNEGITTHVGSIANHPSTSSNFALDDIIYWTVTTAGFLAFTGGDSVRVVVIHEVAGGADCATNAYFRTVEIEYV